MTNKRGDAIADAGPIGSMLDERVASRVNAIFTAGTPQEQIVGLALQGFEYACELVVGRKELHAEAFARKAVILNSISEAWYALPDLQSDLGKWIGTPVEFGKYYRCGASAITTAATFSRSVLHASQVAKVHSVGAVKYASIDSADYPKWQSAFALELETMLIPALNDWPTWEIRRDAEKLVWTVLYEAQATFPETKPEGETDRVQEALAPLSDPQRALVRHILANRFPTSDDELTEHVTEGEKPRAAVAAMVRRINDAWKLGTVPAKINRDGRNPVKNEIEFL